MARTILILILLNVGISVPLATPCQGQSFSNDSAFQSDRIILLMNRVNQHFKSNQWKQIDRNWIRATYFTGLMAFYQATGNWDLYQQVYNWGAKHGWRTGTEWIYPANRLACSQTYLQLYMNNKNDHIIEDTRDFMSQRIKQNKTALEAGWEYVDALYVGTPAYIMMSAATGDSSYAMYANRIFQTLTDSLYDNREHLFYRDLRSKHQSAMLGKKEFWSRGNGWVFAAIPRILNYLPKNDPNRDWYESIFCEMAESIRQCQGEDGFWRSSLKNSQEFPDPESSGTAFFTYGFAWGIRNGILESGIYMPVVTRAWTALCKAVNRDGIVEWGQPVARKPGPVRQSDSSEFVAGAFLLAGSEILLLIRTPGVNADQ